MDSEILTPVVSAIVTLFSAGGVVYLIIESLINRRKNRAEAKAREAESVGTAVSYGVPMVQLYEEVDRIVDKKTKPILAKLDEAVSELDNIKANWCCYRASCEMRIRSEVDAKNAEKDDKYKIIK